MRAESAWRRVSYEFACLVLHGEGILVEEPWVCFGGSVLDEQVWFSRELEFSYEQRRGVYLRV